MKYLILTVLFSYTALAVANDSAAIRLGGRLEFKKSNEIAMLTEDLFISPQKVQVRYTFRNDSKQDIEELIAFPIEEQVWEEDIDLNDFVKQFAFKLNSDHAVTAVEHEVKKTNDHTVRVTYHWRQKFPAGKVVTVSHEYQPSGGFITPKSATEWGDDWQAIVKEYCIEPKLNQWIFQHGQWTHQVHYILTTGANWKKPIEHFKLTIKKGSPTQKVSLCENNIRKVNDTTFELEKHQFVPNHDLQVLFINSAE